MNDDFQVLLDDLADIRTAVEVTVKPSRERSLVLTKIEEAELWLGKCQPNVADDA